MSRWYVKAKHVEHLFQYQDHDDPTIAMAQALQHPQDWTPSVLQGPQWELGVTDATIPADRLTIFDWADHQPPVTEGPGLGEHELPGDEHDLSSYAQAAYREYRRITDGRAGVSLEWRDLNVTARQAWTRAVQKVLAMAAGQDPSDKRPQQPAADQVRYDMVVIPEEGFSLGISKLAPVGVKILVVVDDRQFWITKDVHRVFINEMLSGDVVGKRNP